VRFLGNADDDADAAAPAAGPRDPDNPTGSGGSDGPGLAPDAQPGPTVDAPVAATDAHGPAAAAAAESSAPAAGGDQRAMLSEWDLHPAANDADDPPTPLCEACAGTGAADGGIFSVSGQYIRPGPFLEALHNIDPAKLLPPAVLYLHAHESALHHNSNPSSPSNPSQSGPGSVGMVGRMEGVGPLTRAQLIEFLGHTHVKPVRVLDIPGQQPADAYEIPARLREAVHLLHPACAAPFAVNTTRRKDTDHVTPYLPPEHGGPAGQTRLDNLAPLTRLPHRAKTHGRWHLDQTRPGEWIWRSPHGYRYRVDHNGTQPLGKQRD
jgi:hypothetical protein